MRHTLSVLALVTISACHVADVEALEQHMLRECFIVPLSPSCATVDGNDAQARLVFERFAQRQVTRIETEECLLDVDCSEGRMQADSEGAIEEIQACIASDPSAQSIEENRRARDAACIEECDLTLLDCGDDECDVVTVSSCYAEYDACVAGCPQE
jgi:hypothetical protein